MLNILLYFLYCGVRGGGGLGSFWNVAVAFGMLRLLLECCGGSLLDSHCGSPF